MTAPRLGALAKADVREAARLHKAAFPTFFLSELGEPFLREFYRGFLEPGAVTLVARSSDNVIIGVVVGHVEPSGFFRRLLVRRWYAFAWAGLGLAVRRPSVIPRLFRAISYRGDAPLGADGALLSSICVAPQAQGTGLGRVLISGWTRGVVAAGVRSAYLTTDAQDNHDVNAFYESSGWVRTATYRAREGRRMNCYTWQDARGS